CLRQRDRRRPGRRVSARPANRAAGLMAQLSDDCFAFGGALLPLDEARARIAAAHTVKSGIARVALGKAVGRVLAHDAVAPFDLPPTDNSAVDGFAVHLDDL